MAEVARACPQLEVLLADSCYGFHYGVPAVRDDAELGRLAALSGSLRELNLRLGGAVTASGLACLAGLCNLTALGIFLGEPGGKGSRQGEPPYLPWFEVPFFVDRNQQPTMQCFIDLGNFLQSSRENLPLLYPGSIDQACQCSCLTSLTQLRSLELRSFTQDSM